MNAMVSAEPPSTCSKHDTAERQRSVVPTYASGPFLWTQILERRNRPECCEIQRSCATPRRLQIFLYLPSGSVAGIVVFGVELRFHEAPSIAMNRTSPEFLSGWKDIAKYLG